MSLAQRSKFHVLLIGPKNGTFENRPSKGRSGTSGLNFYLGLTGVNAQKYRMKSVNFLKLRFHRFPS